MKLFRPPLYKDWTLWLAAFGILAGVMSVVGAYSNVNATPGVNAGMTGSMVVDLASAVAFQFALFGIVPASIRRAVQNRREQNWDKHHDPATNSPRQTLAAERDDRVERFVDSFRGDA